jgi:transcriptional regulator with XRE-family HTH domain
MSANTASPVPYKKFGDFLVQLRRTAGIPHQAELASLLQTSQQTVSRWEAGKSRPRDKEMPIIARVLRADVNQLLAAAGYTTRTIVTSLDQPFPIEALSPDSFERFCMYFLTKLYPSAKVHRAGKSGHAQYGIDLEVTFSDETCYTFQCKRVEKFGPEKVHATVAAHRWKSKRRFILLARIATPKSRNAVKEHEGWDIWDKEDISRLIRDLPKDEQLRLVDTFFPGLRLPLLGQTEPGAWQTLEEFFAPYCSGKGAFSHAWELVGRTRETNKLLAALADDDLQGVFLIGPGGAGKSRILKQVIAEYQSRSPETVIRFLSLSGELTPKSIEQLGDKRKLIIVDDAHERGDLGILFQYASIAEKNTKILLSLRPYGLDYLRAQASTFSLTNDRTCLVKLEALSLAEGTALAAQVLKQFGAPTNRAEDIARLTRDCPLATVVGAQIVAKKGVHFELAKNEDDFHFTLLGKFRDVIAGSIGSKGDEISIRKLLRVIALLQPIHPDDESLAKILNKMEDIERFEFKRLIRLLIDAGVVFHRGGQYRLSPDMLADYVIQETCIDSSGNSTGYAELIFDEANSGQIEHLFFNLGKLDWRLANGDPSSSKLLDRVWDKLLATGDDSLHVNAVSTVAYYQPHRALEFVELLLRKGRALRELPTIAKHAAYNYRYLPRACECLWELAKIDDRGMDQHSGHAIRILSDLCAIEPNKPIEYNEAVVDFALSLLPREDSWVHAYSPLDILKGVLGTEGHTSTLRGRSISLEAFHVRPDVVSQLRSKVIDAIIELLLHDDAKVASLAAGSLHEALRYPMGAVGAEARAAWTREFIKTLEKTEQAVQSNNLHPVILVGIVSAISWHTNYADEDTQTIAKRIVDSIPKSLGFRVTLAFIDAYGHFLDGRDYAEHERQWNQFLESLATELLSAYPDGEHLRSVLDQHLLEIEAYHRGRDTTPSILISTIVRRSSPLARAIVQNALSDLPSRTKRFAGIALRKLLGDKQPEAIAVANQFLASGRSDLAAAIGDAFWGLDPTVPLLEQHIAVLRSCLASTYPQVVRNAAHGIRTVAEQDKRLAIDLLKGANLGIASNVADDALMIFHDDKAVPFGLLTKNDIEPLLAKLCSLFELDGFWIETFLAKVSEHFPALALDFFMRRVTHSADTQDWSYRPCNYGPYINVPLRFRRSPEFPSLFRQLSEWMESRPLDDYIFQHWTTKLFESIFRPFDAGLIECLQSWLDGATEVGIQIITQILREADPEFIFEHYSFVIRFLEKSKQFGHACLKRSIDALYASATMGPFSGTFGEPFPRDIKAKEKSEAVLRNIPRFSAAHELYEAVRGRAEANMKDAVEDARLLEE